MSKQTGEDSTEAGEYSELSTNVSKILSRVSLAKVSAVEDICLVTYMKK